jgi:hypothetical protein
VSTGTHYARLGALAVRICVRCRGPIPRIKNRGSIYCSLLCSQADHNARNRLRARAGMCGRPAAPGEWCELPKGHAGKCGHGSRVAP